MGQILGKGVKTDGVVDRSGLYGQCTAAPSDIDRQSPVRFGKLREMHRRREEVISAQGLTLSDMEILNTPVIEGPDLADSLDRLLYGLDLDSDTVQNPVKSKSVRDEEIQPAQAHIEAVVEEDIQLTSVRLSEEKLEDSKTPSVNMQGLSDSRERFFDRLDLDSNAVQNPVKSKSVRDEEIQPAQAHIEAVVEEDIQLTSVRLSEEKLEDSKTPSVNMQGLSDSRERFFDRLDLDSNAVQNPVKSKSVRDEEIQPAQAHIEAVVEEDIQQSLVRLSEEKLEDSKTPSVNMQGLSDSRERFLDRLDLDSDAVQNPVPSKSVRDEEIQPAQAHIEAVVEEDIQQSLVRLSEEKLEDSKTPSVNMQGLSDSRERFLDRLDLDSDAVQNPVKSKSVRDEEIQPAQAHIEAVVEEDIQLTSVRLSEEKLEDSKTPSVNMQGLSDSRERFFDRLDLDSDAVQNPVKSKSVRDEEIQPAQAHIEAVVEEDIQLTSVRLSEEKLEDSKTPSVNMQEINSCMYAVGEILAASTRGVVYAGTRVHDGLEVALKCVHTSRHLDYIRIPGHPDPLPREVALQMLACDDGNNPEIVQLLDWEELLDRYIMVLERPSPCKGLNKFVASRGGKLDEELAKRIIWQASVAANICCEQGVFHRDITLENLIINTDMNDVKLVNFGCGELLKKSTYDTFTGTREYVCPEFFKTGKYNGKQATVYSLGVLLFTMLCGKFPSSNDRFYITERAWIKDGLTEECCRLVEDCLQEDPEKRINLESICGNEWFQDDSSDDLQFPFNTGIRDQSRVLGMEINGCQYEIAGKLGQGGFGTVFKGTRLHDILKVAVKFVRKGPLVKYDYISIPGYPRPFPREVGLHLLACEGECVPVIVQLLDWQETPKHFIMVLERPYLCMDVQEFVEHHGGTVTEKIAQRILWQAAEAAEVCCKRGVFHRDIKLENLLINPDTLEVKLIDFGCGDLLKSSPYNSYMGTRSYACPEWLQMSKYYGKPATVYSLGVLLFILLCGKFPAVRDKFQINECTWSKEGLSQGCCQFVIDCLQEDPEKRMDLERVRFHEWFQDLDPANNRQTSVPTGKHEVVRFPDDSGSNFNGHAEILILHSSDNQSHTLYRQSHISDRQSNTSDSRLYTLYRQSHTSYRQSHTSYNQSHTSENQSHTLDNQLHTSYSQIHTSNSQLHTSYHQVHTLDSQLHTSVNQLHTSDSHLHTSVNQLHTLDSQFHTSDTQLHTSDTQLHTSHNQLHTSDSQSEEKREDDEESSMFVLVINGCQYEIGSKLGQGGFGTVYEGKRVRDGLKVAVKYVEKTKRIIQNYIYIPGYPRPFPREVGLHLLARKGDNVPLIVQLLDWQDYPEQYVMVLELPSPCEDVRSFVEHNGGTVTEVIARTILRQAAEAAQVCCERGVFHRDIKQQNLLINPNTLEVKLIDFGCGDLLKSSAYDRYMGTKQYTCPEYAETGLYHGKPATVYSLGVLLFAMVCGEFPSCLDLIQINNKKWSKDGLTAECCDFIQACLQRNPDKRINLGEILEHAWF